MRPSTRRENKETATIGAPLIRDAGAPTLRGSGGGTPDSCTCRAATTGASTTAAPAPRAPYCGAPTRSRSHETRPAAAPETRPENIVHTAAASRNAPALDRAGETASWFVADPGGSRTSRPQADSWRGD